MATWEGSTRSQRQPLRRHGRRAAESLNLSGPLAEVREQLDRILNLERDELAKRDDEDAGSAR